MLWLIVAIIGAGFVWGPSIYEGALAVRKLFRRRRTNVDKVGGKAGEEC